MSIKRWILWISKASKSNTHYTSVDKQGIVSEKKVVLSQWRDGGMKGWTDGQAIEWWRASILFFASIPPTLHLKSFTAVLSLKLWMDGCRDFDLLSYSAVLWARAWELRRRRTRGNADADAYMTWNRLAIIDPNDPPDPFPRAPSWLSFSTPCQQHHIYVAAA